MTAPVEPRTPPRFVPTLTDVVQVADGWLPPQPMPAGPPAAPQPVVDPEPMSAPGPMPEAWAAVQAEPEWTAGGGSAAGVVPGAASLTADHLAAWSDRVTGRVIEQLEQRLAALLEEHARLLSLAAVQALHDELPALVQEAVQASLASSDPLSSGGSAARRFPDMDAADSNAG